MSDLGLVDGFGRPRNPEIRMTMMPRDTNAHGTIFGGVLLSYIDLAGAIAARPYCDRVVTVKMTEVIFHQPVFVGDVVNFFAWPERIGKTSITIGVLVEAERAKDSMLKVKVTEAQIVYVNIDENRHPTPIKKKL
jgi:acyl-CoA thioesterase YciA